MLKNLQRKYGKTYPALLKMDEESFDSIYYSLEDDEQDKIDNMQDDLETEFAVARLVMRYVDACNGNTRMRDDGVLEITERSSISELPIDMTTFVMMSAAGMSTIHDAETMEVDDRQLDVLRVQAIVSLHQTDNPYYAEGEAW